jgi:NAD(P)H dehydrogenase (quinone)
MFITNTPPMESHYNPTASIEKHGGLMRISIILGHPNPESFNHALARAVQDQLVKLGHSVTFHDLYAEGFDPNLPITELSREAELPPLVKKHCDEIVQVDGIVIVHPNWWGQPPAMLKGWVDRVLRQGTTYKFQVGDNGEGVPVGLLKAKTALIINTSNTPQEREKAVFGDPLENLWGRCIFYFCGVKKVIRRNFAVIVVSTPEERKQWLLEAAALAAEVFPK